MTEVNTATVSTDDLITVINAAAKQRTAWRKEIQEAQAKGDLRERNRIAKMYHPLSDTLLRLCEAYVDGL